MNGPPIAGPGDAGPRSTLPAGSAGYPGAEPAGVGNGWCIGPPDDPDRYVLLGVGRRGGEGVTWEAAYRGDLAMPVRVAVKQILRPPGASPLWPGPHECGRWQDQLEVLRSAPSPHLVAVRELFLGEAPHPPGQRAPASRFPYLVMEFVPGRTLEDAARDGASAAELTAAVRQLADAVAALHSATRTAGNPMVHRDIKPENCILHPRRGLVLVDLGTLQRLDEGFDPRMPFSPYYTAPEVLRDLGAPRRMSSDLYSVGAVLYRCITGSPPPDPAGPGSAGVMSSALRDAATRHRIRPAAELAARTMAMLNPDPRARPTGVVAWASQIDELVRRSRSRRRRVLRTATALVCAATAVATGVLFAVTEDRGAPPAPQTATATPTAPTAPAAQPTAFVAYGRSFADFPTTVDGDRLTITPPLGADRYSHLWGFQDDTTRCAVDVEFDVVVDGDRGNGFGVAVAPRGRVEGDQPYGASVQYEWDTGEVNGSAGTYLRPAELPGGAWEGVGGAMSAPDIGGSHHVHARAVGTTLEMTVDGVTARYEVPAVECGGVGIRAWGGTVRVQNLRVTGQ